jgi:hypothetical protein
MTFFADESLDFTKAELSVQIRAITGLPSGEDPADLISALKSVTLPGPWTASGKELPVAFEARPDGSLDLKVDGGVSQAWASIPPRFVLTLDDGRSTTLEVKSQQIRVDETAWNAARLSGNVAVETELMAIAEQDQQRVQGFVAHPETIKTSTAGLLAEDEARLQAFGPRIAARAAVLRAAWAQAEPGVRASAVSRAIASGLLPTDVATALGPGSARLDGASKAYALAKSAAQGATDTLAAFDSAGIGPGDPARIGPENDAEGTRQKLAQAKADADAAFLALAPILTPPAVQTAILAAAEPSLGPSQDPPLIQVLRDQANLTRMVAGERSDDSTERAQRLAGYQANLPSLAERVASTRAAAAAAAHDLAQGTALSALYATHYS